MYVGNTNRSVNSVKNLQRNLNRQARQARYELEQALKEEEARLIAEQEEREKAALEEAIAENS